MRITNLTSLAAGFLLFAVPALAATDGRYTAPSGEFSIAMQTTMDKEFYPGPATGNADIVLVDFAYGMAKAHSGFAQRSIEWLRLSAPVDPAAFDVRATDTVTGYLEGRFAGSKFAVTDRKKARNDAGQLVYSFAASGAINGTPTEWRGAVLFFDSGVALVSQLYTAVTKPLLDADGITDAELAQWAGTITPGK